MIFCKVLFKNHRHLAVARNSLKKKIKFSVGQSDFCWKICGPTKNMLSILVNPYHSMYALGHPQPAQHNLVNHVDGHLVPWDCWLRGWLTTGCLTPIVLMVQWFGFPDSHLTLPCMLWHIWPRGKKNRTQVHCTSFLGGIVVEMYGFFLSWAEKMGTTCFFDVFWGGDVFETWYFFGSWCSINEITSISTFIWEIRYFDISTNNKKMHVFHLNLSNLNQLCNFHSCATKSQNPQNNWLLQKWFQL